MIFVPTDRQKLKRKYSQKFLGLKSIKGIRSPPKQAMLR